MITWGSWYWPLFLTVASFEFAIPEAYALITKQSANTLSDYSWDELHINSPFTYHSAAWGISLLIWLVFVVAITLHIWWKLT